MSSSWLQRNSPALQTYQTILFTIICILELVVLSLIITLNARERKLLRTGRALLQAPTIEQLNDWDEQVDNQSVRERQMLIAISGVAVFNMVHVFFVTLIDGYIRATNLSNTIADANSASSIGWDFEYMSLFTRLLLQAAVILSAAFLLVPAVQLLLAYYILSKHAFSTERHPLSHWISKAKYASVLLALLWSLVCVGLTFLWPPATDNFMLRYVSAMGAYGSALMWLHASVFFTYRADMLADIEVPAAEAGLKQLVAEFGSTVVAAYAWDEKKPLLPVAEKV